MTPFIRMLCSVAPAIFIAMASSGQALAQSDTSGCTLESAAGTNRQTLHCQGGLTISAEGNAHYSLVDRNHDGKLEAVKLEDKALLIDLPKTKTGTNFEIITPQAIAAVRGTKWAVDVNAGTTSVLVVRGKVSVKRPAGKTSVLLGPGEGVDVDNKNGALAVRRWPAARAAALLARFGQ